MTARERVHYGAGFEEAMKQGINVCEMRMSRFDREISRITEMKQKYVNSKADFQCRLTRYYKDTGKSPV